jgi:hypothetical protein
MGGGHVTDGRLVVPEGLVIDEVARERLVRQLACQPAEIKGVAAEVDELPAGSSYRVQAEWSSLEPLSAVVRSTAAVRAAVLTRPDVRFDVTDGLVGVDGPFVIDRGAHVHDPWTPVGPLLDASERGRPPFPRRPVVVFAATEIDPDTADWARRMVNRLVRREVEGRLALPTAFGSGADGLHLTRPCRSGAESVHALAPDVIVTLDAGAAEQASAWCGADRSTVIVELVDDPAITQRLVSWQIERARGRVRAQISRRVGAPGLARLVVRLCAGPHPAPPTDEAADRAASTRTVRENWGSETNRPTAVILTGTSEAALRVDGLVDHFEAAGVRVAVAPVEPDVPAGARVASLVVLAGVTPSAPVSELIETRTAAGLPTVLDVDSASVSAGAVALPAAVEKLASECGYAVSPVDGVRDALRGDIRFLTMPPMLTRARAGALRSAATSRASEENAGVTIGWYVGSAAESRPDYLDAVAEGIAKVLVSRPDLHVDVVGSEDGVPLPLRGHDRVTRVPAPPEPESVAAWSVHVWTPRIVGDQAVSDLIPLIEAGTAGVPSVLPLPARRALDGAAAADLVVSRYDEPEGWAAALRRAFDDDRKRDRAASAARRWAQAVHGSPACRASVTRLLGWARKGTR